MIDVAFDLALGLQHHLPAADRTLDRSPNDDLLGDDSTSDPRALADHDVATVDIALHFAIDLDLTVRNKVADDDEVRTYDRDAGPVTPDPAGRRTGPGRTKRAIFLRLLVGKAGQHGNY